MARSRSPAMLQGWSGADLGAVFVEVGVTDPVRAVLDYSSVAVDDGGEPTRPDPRPHLLPPDVRQTQTPADHMTATRPRSSAEERALVERNMRGSECFLSFDDCPGSTKADSLQHYPRASAPATPRFGNRNRASASSGFCCRSALLSAGTHRPVGVVVVQLRAPGSSPQRYIRREHLGRLREPLTPYLQPVPDRPL